MFACSGTACAADSRAVVISDSKVGNEELVASAISIVYGLGALIIRVVQNLYGQRLIIF